jgi:hypothetical protein
MNFEKYEQGLEALSTPDNTDWISKVNCWVKKENGYNIYIFQVVVEDEADLETYYERITAAIATEFQALLEKAIERWNIYLVFESKEKISDGLRGRVEQDKYSSRKLVWESLSDIQLEDSNYLLNRLLNLEINRPEATDTITLTEKIKRIDNDLYNTICVEDRSLDQQVALYLGRSEDE